MTTPVEYYDRSDTTVDTLSYNVAASGIVIGGNRGNRGTVFLFK